MKKRMAKVTGIALVAAMVIGLAACGSSNGGTADAGADAAASAGTEAAASGEIQLAEDGKLHMATNAAFEPYEFYDGETIVGIDADMAQAICDILGYELEISDMEFSSIINAVQTGKADIGVAGMTVTEDRLKNIDFSEPYTTATQVIIVKAE